MSKPFKRTQPEYVLPGNKYRTPDGQRVTRDTPGAICIQRESKCYYGKYTDANGRPRLVKLTTNFEASKRILSQKIVAAALGANGLVDKFAAQAKRPLADHLEDYGRYLLAEGDTERHVAQTLTRCKIIIGGIKAVFIKDLLPEPVNEFLHGLRRDPRRPVLEPGKTNYTASDLADLLGENMPARLPEIIRREGLTVIGTGPKRMFPKATVESLIAIFCRGIGVSTSNGYLVAIKGFSRWLTSKERADRDRLVSLSRLQADLDQRHERRALPESELVDLLSATASSNKIVHGFDGADRHALYAVAMGTGFRASELASLDADSFQLDRTPPYVIIQAAYAKNRKKQEQPIPEDVAALLATYLQRKNPTGQVWPGKWSVEAAEMLRVDLAAAGIPYRDDEAASSTSMPCDTVTSRCCPAPAFRPRSRRNWPGTPTSN